MGGRDVSSKGCMRESGPTFDSTAAELFDNDVKI